MSVIELNPTNCRNCYKCIRECPIKAIEFKDGRAKIIEKECVLCGICVQSCPQNAKYIRNDADRARELIASGKPVYASVAPSWQAWYEGVDFPALSAALKALGFAGVEETAIGAAATSHEYEKLMAQGNMKNIISTACSSVVMMVERHYPELISYLTPISSPMMAHARLMRETYGDIKVVFIGPCLSKKDEASDPLAGGMVNQALTFSSLDEWMEKQGVALSGRDAAAVGVRESVARLYPRPRGILETIPQENYGKYRPLAVDGIFRCIELFEALAAGKLENTFVEANICAGGCLGGPIMRMGSRRAILLEQSVSSLPLPHDDACAPTATKEFPHPRVFANRAERAPQPSEEDIRKILARIGKYTQEQELNCGGCGYPTCRAKALAVYRGKADINMCLPFFRERAENLSNMVMENSPNAIVAFDSDLLVQELNPAAEAMFHITRAGGIGMPIPEFYGESAFDEAKETGAAVSKKLALSDGSSAEETFIYIREHDMYLAFVKDISGEEQRQKELAELRAHTIDTAQQVIDKQMRVAQEIASLLGETTAETKVALTNLKKSMAEKHEPAAFSTR